MFGKLFGKKTGQARAAVSKLANRDLMEAVVYGSIYVAAADGELEDSELSKIETILSNNPALQGFGAELSTPSTVPRQISSRVPASCARTPRKNWATWRILQPKR